MKKEIQNLENAITNMVDTFYNKHLKKELENLEKSTKQLINQIGEKTIEALEQTPKSINSNEEKLLIYIHEYDSVHFHSIINKKDIEAFVSNWINKFLKSSQSRTNVFNYVSHTINKEHINIFFDVQTQVGLHTFNNTQHVETISFINLNNITTWIPDKAQAKPSIDQTEALEKTKYMRDNIVEPPIQADKLPNFIKIDETLFLKYQISDIPHINYNPVYTDSYDEHSFFVQNGKTLLKYDYLSIELKVKATINQMETIRKNLKHPPSYLPKKINKLLLKDTMENKDIYIEGYLRDISFIAYDLKNAPSHLDLSMCFVISKIELE